MAKQVITFKPGDAVQYKTHQGNAGAGVVDHIQEGKRGAFVVVKDVEKDKVVKVRASLVESV